MVLIHESTTDTVMAVDVLVAILHFLAGPFGLFYQSAQPGTLYREFDSFVYSMLSVLGTLFWILSGSLFRRLVTR